MPGRVSRSSLPSKAPVKSQKANKKRKQRSLNAFAIAQHEVTDGRKVKQHRLGETEEDDQPRRKKQRVEDDEDEGEDDEDSNARHQQKRRGQSDGLDIGSGSDSEGNEWQLGVVGQDDDSDLDSEEAFGESDEERFEGFSFRGSSSNKKGPRGKPATQRRARATDEVDLNEDEEGSTVEDEDDLGDDAVDLATMLDDDNQSEDDEEEEEEIDEDQEKPSHKKLRSKVKPSPEEDDFGGFEDDGVGSDDDEANSEAASDYSDDEGAASDFSISDVDSDDNDPEKLRQLRDAISSLNKAPDATRNDTDPSNDAARMLNALKGMSGLDPALTRSVKKLSRSTGTAKADKADDMVKVPLPKRQQDRIDRGVAYDKAKETLNRWIDTVKHNRRAEHLTFPLQDPHAQEAQGTSRLQPTASDKPRTELESTIQSILEASGLVGQGRKSGEEQIESFETLQANKLPPEEVLARRAELRKARELLFRGEVRAKRIKKIKSKSYRRVHRKEAQKEAQKQRDLLTAAGVDLSEDEKEANDRRRAEERMGARHRESRWAKSVKETGRGAWDEDSRDAVAEMARKNEELRKRMEGRKVRREDESGDGLSGESDDDDISDDEDDEEGGGFRLRRQLDKVQQEDPVDATQSKLGQLKFMQRADAARKQRNDEDAQRLQRELDGVESDEGEAPETSIGRKLFGPTDKSAELQIPNAPRAEFEEGHSSGSEDEAQGGADGAGEAGPSQQKPEKKTAPKKKAARGELAKPPAEAKAFNPQRHKSAADTSSSDSDAATTAPPTTKLAKPPSAPSNTSGWTEVPYTTQSTIQPNLAPSDNTPEDGPSDDPLISNHDLVLAAFGDADTETSFAAEKHDLAASEDEKTTSTALPGWGTWTGTGLSARAKKATAARNAKYTTTTPGVAPAARKDARLKDVIISEKRVKKNARYLAERLPHPFESRAQYERSLRMPVGPEWSTKAVYQESTKPRVMVKAGRVVAAMREPMV